MINKLGQFYTEDLISNLMISRILNKNPKTIVELGIGQGSLAKAALKRWKNSRIIGIDIDANNIETLKTTFPKIQCFLINGLSSNLSSNLKIKLGSVDVGICNPPYLTVKKNPEIEKILISAGLGDFNDYTNISSDLVFLAQNLNLIKLNGELAIILPDGLITSHQFHKFRKLLLANYAISACIELPSKIFKKTEAKTYILIIKKTLTKSKKINLFLANNSAELIDKISISIDKAIHRMDYTYYSLMPKPIFLSNGVSLEDLNAKIFRGSLSKKSLETRNYEYIHTNSFNQLNEDLVLEDKKVLPQSNFNYAKEGDILIPRVGKSCLGKVMRIVKGEILISDCVYVIRIDKQERNELFNILNSDYGRKWIIAHAHGVCAQVISKKDLLKFKIPLNTK